jgi:hypothetical protein
MEHQMTDTLYWKTLSLQIQGVSAFGGRKSVKNVPKMPLQGTLFAVIVTGT